jgi:uncharacterized protein YydD (DUF2326 family)
LDYESKVPICFARITLDIDNGRKAFTTDSLGGFSLSLPENTSNSTIRVEYLGYAELNIINVLSTPTNKIEIGDLYLIEQPAITYVSFTGISSAKELEYQQEIIDKYNNNLKRYKDIKIENGLVDYWMRVSTVNQNKDSRMKLKYIIDYKEMCGDE